MGMVEPCDSGDLLGEPLLAESGTQGCMKHLECNSPSVLSILGQEHRGRAAPADLVFKDIPVGQRGRQPAELANGGLRHAASLQMSPAHPPVPARSENDRQETVPDSGPGSPRDPEVRSP